VKKISRPRRRRRKAIGQGDASPPPLVSRKLAIDVGVIALFLALAGGTIYMMSLASAPPALDSASANSSKAWNRPGDSPRRTPDTAPWGRLHTQQICISPPPEFLAGLETRDGSGRWLLPGLTREDLAGSLAGMDLTASQRKQILASIVDSSARGLTLAPADETILGLSPQARGQLYHMLRDHDANAGRWYAYRFWGRTENWLMEAALLEPVLDRVRKLTYRNGQVRFFADQRLVLPMLETPEQRQRLLAVLSREATLLVKLQLKPGHDVDKLVSWWGRGGRRSEVRPLIESVVRAGGGEIDIVHLLPTFARQRLYRYPRRPASDVDVRRDCHWSALNFFNEVPDDAYADTARMVDRIRGHYTQIDRDPRFGDLVLFFDGPDLIHSAVYIAEDILFTKNGSRITTPWMFITVEAMRDYYAALRGSEIRYYRLKSLVD
jgi:hypothetical protein